MAYNFTMVPARVLKLSKNVSYRCLVIAPEFQFNCFCRKKIIRKKPTEGTKWSPPQFK